MVEGVETELGRVSSGRQRGIAVRIKTGRREVMTRMLNWTGGSWGRSDRSHDSCSALHTICLQRKLKVRLESSLGQLMTRQQAQHVQLALLGSFYSFEQNCIGKQIREVTDKESWVMTQLAHQQTPWCEWTAPFHFCGKAVSCILVYWCLKSSLSENIAKAHRGESKRDLQKGSRYKWCQPWRQ